MPSDLTSTQDRRVARDILAELVPDMYGMVTGAVAMARSNADGDSGRDKIKAALAGARYDLIKEKTLQKATLDRVKDAKFMLDAYKDALGRFKSKKDDLKKAQADAMVHSEELLAANDKLRKEVEGLKATKARKNDATRAVNARRIALEDNLRLKHGEILKLKQNVRGLRRELGVRSNKYGWAESR
ncbi:hypothetical protein P154DRAFT_520083 [Amniculicola lignicola CBS 123094]|uniref:Uncharacterized protein n=1 Tax=Amniculicola lignicola CBS 123094 TaxID=1392246 RepID=A0A6A5WPL7_9PLEO|nr:hypothetical protein P154DRAFT_520083 [Amniculicola lignicola CBS 123094]